MPAPDLTTYFAVPYRRPRLNRFGKPIEAKGRVIDTTAPAIALVPKAASSSIASAVMAFARGDRVTLPVARRDHPTRVMFVRDPLIRLVSCFSFFWEIARNGSEPDGVAIGIIYEPNRSVQADYESFVDHILSGVVNRHFWPQHALFSDATGFVPTIVHTLDGVMKQRPGRTKTYWEGYYEGFLPVSNSFTRQRIDTSYRLAEVRAYYAADSALYDSVVAAGGTWTAP